MRFCSLAILFLALVLSACCGNDAPAPQTSPYSGELVPVVGEPVRGACIEIPLLGCKLCVGLSCDVPEVVTPAVFGRPVETAPQVQSDPCAEVYASPCGSASESWPSPVSWRAVDRASGLPALEVCSTTTERHPVGGRLACECGRGHAGDGHAFSSRGRSMVDCRPHAPEEVGSIPAPATTFDYGIAPTGVECADCVP